MTTIFFMLLLACFPVDANDTGFHECSNMIVFDCEDDIFGTGQMVFKIQVPDYEEDYESVDINLVLQDGKILEGTCSLAEDNSCGSYWEAEFRLFNESCENVVSHEISLNRKLESK
jgi:hypothetical protein